jgi:hypothetical protein
MSLPAAQVAARSFLMSPVDPLPVGPPVTDFAQVDGTARLPEHARTRNEQGGIRVRVVGGIWRTLDDRRVAGGLYRAPELHIGYGLFVDPKAIDGNAMHRRLLRVEIVRAHQKDTTRHPDHLFVRRPKGVPRTLTLPFAA